jgi:hypothetical protein
MTLNSSVEYKTKNVSRIKIQTPTTTMRKIPHHTSKDIADG